MEDRGGDPALVPDPESARLEACVGGEAGTVFCEQLGLLLVTLVYLTDVL